MNQCVPSWDVDENPTSPRFNVTRPRQSKSNCNSLTVDVPTLDYEVAELTWKNGQLAMHGLGLRRVPDKSTWEKPSAGNGGTLESLVNQATTLPKQNAIVDHRGGGGTADELVPWFAVPPSASTASDTMTMSAALVPCTNNSTNKVSQGHSAIRVLESVPGFGARMGECSTRVESCSGVPDTNKNVTIDHSVSNSATWGRNSYQVTFDTCERELCTAGFTSASMGSPENTSSAKQWNKNGGDEHDSVCHNKTEVETGDEEEKKKGKSSNPNKRGRAAAIHNQSERKRRDKINQRMKTLQKLIPNSSKTDKASMLDEVIEYLKQLQAQIQMMKGMNMSSMMFPMAMQQQLQMSMMGPMGMGMPGMGMAGMGVMDMNTLAGRTNMPGMPPPAFHPSAYMPMASWDGNADRLPATVSAMPDPLSAFFACQLQPMTMDAYTRMATLYQQFQQPHCPSSKP